MPFQLSPGVVVQEKDFTSIVPAVATSAGAFAGVFQWGPILDPVTITSENELVTRFGKPNDTQSVFTSFYTAANFLSYANNLLVVRASGDDYKNAVAETSGGVTSVAVDTAGSGYTTTPTVTIAAPDDASGTTATATATLTGTTLASVTVDAGGENYTSASATVSAPPSGGTTATVTVSVSGGAIDSITVDTAGSGYIEPPTITITGDGTGASATGVLTATSVASVTVSSAGSGYYTAPTVTFSGGGGSSAAATATITETGVLITNQDSYTDTYSAGAGAFGPWAAKWAGTIGNSLKVAMCDSQTFTGWEYEAQFDGAPGTSAQATAAGSSNDELHIIVVDEDGLFSGTAGTVLEKYAYVSKASDAKKSDGTNNYYRDVINANSRYIWWMDHTTQVATSVAGTGSSGVAWGVAFASATAGFKDLDDTTNADNEYSLTGGADDFSATDGQLQAGFAIFNNAELYDISLIMMGKASATNATYVVNNVAESRLDAVVFVSPEDNSTGAVITDANAAPTTALTTYRDSLPSSSYMVIDSGYKYQYDRYNDKYRYVPLNGDIAGLCARTDYTNDPWFSPAGYNRGQVKNVVKLAYNPNKTARDTLYKKGINPVVTFPGQGTVMFGDKTGLSAPSAFDRINVRRLFIVLEKAISTAAKFQLFEFNDAFTRAQFKNLVEPFLRDVQGRRGITDFAVVCDETNNTGEIIDRNEFVCDIFIKPNRSINFITLTFVAARSSVSFDEIGG